MSRPQHDVTAAPVPDALIAEASSLHIYSSKVTIPPATWSMHDAHDAVGLVHAADGAAVTVQLPTLGHTHAVPATSQCHHLCWDGPPPLPTRPQQQGRCLLSLPLPPSPSPDPIATHGRQDRRTYA